MGSLVISAVVWASRSVLTVMLSACLEGLKEKFSIVSFCRLALIVFCMLVVRGVSHLYWRRVCLGGGAWGFVRGVFDSVVGMKNFLV